MKKHIILFVSLFVLAACNNEETVSLEEHENLQAENEKLKTKVDKLEAKNEILEDVSSDETNSSTKKNKVNDFLDVLASEMEGEDVRFSYTEPLSMITVTYYGEMEDVTRLALRQIGTDAYEEDKEELSELMRLYSQTFLEMFGEGYSVQLKLESKPLPVLYLYTDGEYIFDNMDLYAEQLLEQ